MAADRGGSERVQVNLAWQREHYGEQLGDRVRRLVLTYRVSQAHLARVLGVSPSMLSQTMNGRRQKIANPAVLARMVLLERGAQRAGVAVGDPVALDDVRDDVRDVARDVARDEVLDEVLAEVGACPPAEAVADAAAPGCDTLVEALRHEIDPAELAESAVLLRAACPALARLLERAAR